MFGNSEGEQSTRQGLLIALQVGAFVRLLPLVFPPFPRLFPIRGGGLYTAFSVSILQNGFGYPEIIPFFSPDGVPFVYPPLAFYGVAALSKIPGLDPIVLHTVLPIVLSILVVPLFYLLADEYLEKGSYALFGTFIFAATAGVPDFMTGDGLVEVAGTAFLLIGLLYLVRFIREHEWKDGILAGVLFALTTLASPGGAYGFVIALVVLSIFESEGYFDVRAFLTVSVIGAIGSAPWWYTVISNHGVSMLVTAFSSRQDTARALVEALQYDPLLTVFWGALAFFGAFYCASKRDFTLPVWFGVLLLAGEITYLRALPGAMLAAVGLIEIVYPSLEAMADEVTIPGDFLAEIETKQVLQLAFAGLILVHGLFFAVIETTQVMHQPDQDEINSMRLAGQETAPNSTFVIVAPVTRWWIADWFPLIAQRKTITQYGGEWEGYQQDYSIMSQKIDDMRSYEGINALLEDNGIEYTHLYVVDNEYSSNLHENMQASSCVNRTVEAPAASVYEKTC
jgi:hypothetical protein